jgi:Zn-dependent protease with chaperone function
MAYSFSRPLRDFVSAITGNSIIIITIYFSFFYLFYFAFSFLLKYVQNLENIKTVGFKIWFDKLVIKEIKIFFALYFIIQIVYFFLEGDVFWWWLPVAFMCLIARFGLEYGGKYATALYLKPDPMGSSELKNRLIEICGRAKVRITDVFYQQGLKGDVVILGFGPRRRLMLNKELADYAHEEIEIIVARETAYLAEGFLLNKIIVQSVAMLFAFFIVNIALRPAAVFFGFEFIFDIETLPVLVGLFFIAFVIMSFVQNYFFFQMERQVDRYALETTQSPDAFISLLIRNKKEETKINVDNFVSRLLYGQLSEIERMNMAQDYAQELAVKQRINDDRKKYLGQ